MAVPAVLGLQVDHRELAGYELHVPTDRGQRDLGQTLAHGPHFRELTPRLIAVNEKVWSGIPEKDRKIVTEAVATHTKWQDNEILSQEASLVDTFKKAGMNVIEPDLESFRKPVLASVPAKFEAKWGKGLWERIAAF